MPINELRSIAIFAKTVELGSLRKAADAQGMTPQAASKAVALLEKHLGARLFHRTTRNMTLTEEGRQFLDTALPAVATLNRAFEATKRSKEEIGGTLRIVAPRSVFGPVLWPLLTEYCGLYPDVHPDVQLEDRMGNWVEDRVDVGFRIALAAADGVIARRLFPLQQIICAAPSYLQRNGVAASLEDVVSQGRCSAYRSAATGRLLPWRLQIEGEAVSKDVFPAFCTNDEALETEIVLAGHVIASLSAVAAAAHIRSGRLVPLFVQHKSERASAFIYYGNRADQPARVRAFIDLAIKRLVGSREFTLSVQELMAAEAAGRAAAQRAA